MLNLSICPSIVVPQAPGQHLRKRSIQDSYFFFLSRLSFQHFLHSTKLRNKGIPSYSLVPIQGIKLCRPKPGQIFIYPNEAKIKHTGRILNFTWCHGNIKEHIFISLKTDPLVTAKYRDLPILHTHVDFTIRSTYLTHTSLNLIFKHNCSISISNRSCLSHLIGHIALSRNWD